MLQCSGLSGSNFTGGGGMWKYPHSSAFKAKQRKDQFYGNNGMIYKLSTMQRKMMSILSK